MSTCLFISHVHIRNNIKRNALVAQDIKGDDTQTVVISKDLRHYAALPVYYYCYSTTYYIYSFTVRTDWASKQPVLLGHFGFTRIYLLLRCHPSQGKYAHRLSAPLSRLDLSAGNSPLPRRRGYTIPSILSYCRLHSGYCTVMSIESRPKSGLML